MSETLTMTLTDFLLARIAEDEAIARAAQIDDGLIRASSRAHEAAQGRAADVAHIARHDPPRVLAECEAKRRIVELHQPDISLDYCATCFTGDFGRLGDPEHEPYPCPTLRALASVHADHPDYDETWKP